MKLNPSPMNPGKQGMIRPRPRLSRMAFAALAALAFAALAKPTLAEDPFLGQIKEIKCVNCHPGWVTLLVHDPIDMRDFNLYIKNSDYNRIITPLAGKRIHDKKGECFYWFDKPKAKDKERVKRGATATPQPADSVKDSSLVASRPDSLEGPGKSIAPPLSTEESEGIASTCLPFVRQIK